MIAHVIRTDDGAHAVDSHCILAQVVAADAAKIAFLCRLFRHQGDGRRLYHYSYRHIAPVRRALALKLIADVAAECLCLAYILNAVDHGEHYPKVAVDRSAERRAQLSAEQPRHCKAQPKRTQPEKRVVLLRNGYAVGLLIAADVQRAQYYRARAEVAECTGIYLVLLIFAWQLLSRQIQKLAPE